MAEKSNMAAARWWPSNGQGQCVSILQTVLLLLSGSVLLPTAVVAQTRPAEPAEEEIESKTGWIELEVKPPPLPKSGNLISFEAGGAGNSRFYIDPDSISVGSDGVVRYTLVIRGPSGAENISYEGIRCETREQKYYAFGRRDGTWSNARLGEWRRIEYKDINRQHGVLYQDYFCPDRKKPIGTPREIIRRLKYGAMPTAG